MKNVTFTALKIRNCTNAAPANLKPARGGAADTRNISHLAKLFHTAREPLRQLIPGESPLIFNN